MNLPIKEVLDELGQALAGSPCAVLRAPPGAGKTTIVPPFLLDADWLNDRKILILAPRRLAARTAALRMAKIIGEKVGQTVGYRVRMDTKVGQATRIEVITEGVLTRMLQSDPSLKGVGLVIFDEFHERSLDADLGLALCIDIRGVLNIDLKILVMSATMETEPVAAMLGDAPVIHAKGRSFPIETRYVGHHTPTNDMAAVATEVLCAAANEVGGILVFLPGAAEIRQVADRLDRARMGDQWRVVPLLGKLSAKEQELAISPAPRGCRKIVLATAIAETSLTIEGIQVVVDSGLQRVPRFDVCSGMTQLVTQPVSRASADQRRGRAGRLGPGVCLRLWSKAINSTLAADRRPEILEADLCGLALELAKWGVNHPGDLNWLDPPPDVAYTDACVLLQALTALNPQNKITRHGHEMASMPVHPRLAHMLLMALRTGHTRAACDLAALLTERDPVRFESGQYDADLQLRYDLLQARRKGRPFHLPAAKADLGACNGILAVSDQLHQRINQSKESHSAGALSLGKLLAWAYPDRIARRRAGEQGRYITAGGQGVRLKATAPLATEEFIVAVDTDGKRRESHIFRAASYEPASLEKQFARQSTWRECIRWDDQRKGVYAQRVLTIGAITLRTEPLDQPDETLVLSAMVQGILQNGIGVLAWNKTLRNWQMRVCFLHGVFSDGIDWPDVSDANLTADIEAWLGPYLSGIKHLRQLARIDLRGALYNRLPYKQHQQLDELAPTHWTVPSGSRIPIDYKGKVPVLAVRIQEMFGLAKTPIIAGGRQPLLLHLLSPAGRPVQVTQDLAGFWKNTYHDVKKDLKGRYSKHYWPDDPLHTRATARAKPRKNRTGL